MSGFHKWEHKYYPDASGQLIWACNRCGALSWRKEKPDDNLLIPYKERSAAPTDPPQMVSCDDGLIFNIMDS